MNLGFHRIAWGAALAALAVGAGLTVQAQPIRRGPPIQFSEPRRETATTNLNALAEEKKNNLQRLEEELNNSFRVLNRDDASGAQRMLPRPPPGPLIQSRKVRELLDRREKQENWVFDSPESRMNGLTPEEIMGISQLDDQGRELSSIPAFERYYNSLGREGLGTTNRDSGSYSDSRENRDTFDGRKADEPPADPLKAKIQEAEQGLRQALREDSGLKSLPTFSDGSVMPKLTEDPNSKTAQTKLQESRLDQFKRMSQTDLAKPVTPSAFSSLPSLSGSLPGDRFRSLNGVTVKPAPALSPPPATTSPAVSGLSGAGLAASPGLAGASHSTPDPVVTRRASPPSQLPEIPRRKF